MSKPKGKGTTPKSRPPVKNGPSKTGNPSGPKRGNHPPQKVSGKQSTTRKR